MKAPRFYHLFYCATLEAEDDIWVWVIRQEVVQKVSYQNMKLV